MTAREAKKACATEGLVIVARGRRNALLHLAACLPTRNGHTGHTVFTLMTESWPLAVAAFLGWRKEWLKGGRK